MRAVNLMEDVPCVKEEDFVLSRRFYLAAVKEPERTFAVQQEETQSAATIFMKNNELMRTCTNPAALCQRRSRGRGGEQTQDAVITLKRFFQYHQGIFLYRFLR